MPRKLSPLDTVRRLAAKLPHAEESTSYGTPAWKVKGKMFARLKEDGETLVVRVDNLDEKEMLLEAEPGILFTTDHYNGYPYVLVRIAKAGDARLTALLAKAWRTMAPAKLLASPPANPTKPKPHKA